VERNSLQAIGGYVKVQAEIVTDIPVKMFLYNTASDINNGFLGNLEHILAHWRRSVDYSGYFGETWVEGEVRPYDVLRPIMGVDIYAQILKAIAIMKETFDENTNYTQEATNKIY
jgi:hypothetical protein